MLTSLNINKDILYRPYISYYVDHEKCKLARYLVLKYNIFVNGNFLPASLDAVDKILKLTTYPAIFEIRDMVTSTQIGPDIVVKEYKEDLIIKVIDLLVAET